MGSFVDLHIHSTYSDGILSPEDLLRKAIKHSLSAISLTDHDSIEGCREVLTIIKKYRLEFITGVELSCTYEGKEIHILGYAIDLDDQQLLYYLEEFKKARVKRAEKIHRKLQSLGIKFDFDLIRKKADKAPITRPHIAAVLQDLGIISNLKEAFIAYIGDGGPAYEPKPNFSFEKAFQIINEAGGIAVLAHPGSGFDQSLLYKMIKAGMDGIEVVHPMHNDVMQRYYHTLAAQYWLLETGGSDYHGSREFDDLNFGKFVMPYSIVESISYHKGLK